MLFDHSPPVLAKDDEARRRVRKSIVPSADLVSGHVAAPQIELAFSREGCGAVLVQLDELSGNIYNTFYELQWQLGSRTFGSATEFDSARARFIALDLPVRQLLCRCAVGIARARLGLEGLPSLPPEDITRLAPLPLQGAVGRPLVANRQEFHPSVDWLIEQENAGRLQRDMCPDIAVVADPTDDGDGAAVLGRAHADETQLLALYREWKSASPEEQPGHGNKYNGNVYYGAFRGRTHVDGGSTMTILFGPGEVRDGRGRPADSDAKCRQYGGSLIVKPPTEEEFTALPYRLPCGSPYLVAFFNDTDGATSVAGIDTNALGWAATVHGVRRLEDTRYSRGQAVVLLRLTNADLT